MAAKSKIAVAVVGALAAGVIIGLLIAPEKGKKLRKRLKRSTGKLSGAVSNFFTHQKEEAEKVI